MSLLVNNRLTYNKQGRLSSCGSRASILPPSANDEWLCVLCRRNVRPEISWSTMYSCCRYRRRPGLVVLRASRGELPSGDGLKCVLSVCFSAEQSSRYPGMVRAAASSDGGACRACFKKFGLTGPAETRPVISSHAEMRPLRRTWVSSSRNASL
jgi:hypothetical protein